MDADSFAVRATTAHDALIHCYNDRCCSLCPMYEECDGDVNMIIRIAADLLAESLDNALISRRSLLKNFREQCFGLCENCMHYTEDFTCGLVVNAPVVGFDQQEEAERKK